VSCASPLSFPKREGDPPRSCRKFSRPPLPPSNLTVPAAPSPPEAAPLRQGPRFVRDVNITGNTVLDEGAIHGVVDPTSASR
jgi:hypothetical protein